jgi:hypothetical protein
VLSSDASDDEVLSWAAEQHRVLVTNDRSTLIRIARRRIEAGYAMPGLIVTTNSQSIGTAIDDILLIAEVVAVSEIESRVMFLPL